VFCLPSAWAKPFFTNGVPMDALLLFILTSLALTGSPGPNTLSLAALSAAFGRGRALPYMAGLNLGMVAVVALVGSGFWAVLLSWPGVAPVVTIAASAYLLFLAFKIATAPPLAARTAEAAAVPPWYAGAAL
jgi:threonine/homoserine/homoserine lactone efflux protein